VTVERKLSTSSLKREKMRDSFFDDPFFKDTWMDIEKSHKNHIEESRKIFE